MKTIDEIVADLSPEERDIHRDLINECRERECSLMQIREELRENLDRLMRISVMILSDFERFYKLSSELEKNRINIKKDLIKESIEQIPDNRFYHA